MRNSRGSYQGNLSKFLSTRESLGILRFTFSGGFDRLTNVRGVSVQFINYLGFPMLMDRSGTGGALAKMEGRAAGENSTIVYSSCIEGDVEAASVTKHGGQVH